MTYTEPDTLPDPSAMAWRADAGRPALALSQTEDWLREELLLDRETYRYLGERSTVGRDARIDPLKAGNESGEIRKGDRVVSERIATAIVDRPGRRP